MNKLFTYLSTPRGLGLFVALSSLAALSGAWISQYGFGLDPCALCFYQRKPYMVNIALGAIAFFLAPKHAKAALWVLALAGLAFVADAGIAAFHVGVEQRWWKGLESCANYAMPSGGTVEELMAFIRSREKPIDCGVPAFILFGISMAGYNFLLATALAITTFITTGRIWRKK